MQYRVNIFQVLQSRLLSAKYNKAIIVVQQGSHPHKEPTQKLTKAAAC